MFVFAVSSLGNIIFVSALVEFLYYIGALGFIVTHLGRLVKKLVGSTEVESFVATANMFLGQTSSPVLISKYIGRMTESEIFVILVAGIGYLCGSDCGYRHGGFGKYDSRLCWARSWLLTSSWPLVLWEHISAPWIPELL